MKWFCLFAGLCVVTPTLSAAEPVQLRYDLTPGETARYRATIQVEMNVNAGGFSFNQPAQTDRNHYELRVAEKQGDLTVVKMVASPTVPESESAEEAGDPILAKPVTIKLNSTGLEAKLDKKPTVQKPAEASEAGDKSEAENSFNNVMGNSLFVWVFPRFKAEPVEIGDEWEQEFLAPVPMGAGPEGPDKTPSDFWKIISTYQGLQERGGRSLAELSQILEGEYSLPAPTVEKTAGPQQPIIDELAIKDFKSSLLVDADTGLLEKTNTSYRIEMSMRQQVATVEDIPGPLTIPTKATFKFNIEVERLEDESAAE